MKKVYCTFLVSTENLKTLKYHIFSKKTLVISIICREIRMKKKKIKEQESTEILTILVLIKNI